MRTYDYNTTIEVDIDDLRDAEVADLIEHRMGKAGYNSETWLNIYEARRTLSEDAFFTYIDELIMNATGRIL
jgi:hypothetical protein